MKMEHLYKVSDWGKYSAYEVKYLNNLHYILPVPGAKLEIYNPSDQFEIMIPMLINIGAKYTEEKMSQRVSNMVVEFANRFGLLGLANIMCINTEGSLDELLHFKSTFKEKAAQISIQNFIRLFSPTAKKGDLVLTKSDNRVRIHPRSNPDGYNHLVCKANELLNLIFSDVYAEPISIFLLYCSNLYKHFHSVENNYSMKLPKILISAPRCTHLSSDDNKTPHVQYIFHSLTSSSSFVYIQMLAEPKRLLKTCKYCGDIFYAANPKTQFCSGNCRNKFNVYKSRNKQEAQS